MRPYHKLDRIYTQDVYKRQDQVFPEYEKVFSKVGIFGKASKAVLSEFSSPDEFNQVSAETLAETLRLASRSRVGLGKAEALKTAAAHSFGIRFAQDAFVFQLRSMICLLYTSRCV